MGRTTVSVPEGHHVEVHAGGASQPGMAPNQENPPLAHQASPSMAQGMIANPMGEGAKAEMDRVINEGLPKSKKKKKKNSPDVRAVDSNEPLPDAMDEGGDNEGTPNLR